MSKSKGPRKPRGKGRKARGEPPRQPRGGPRAEATTESRGDARGGSRGGSRGDARGGSRGDARGTSRGDARGGPRSPPRDAKRGDKPAEKRPSQRRDRGERRVFGADIVAGRHAVEAVLRHQPETAKKLHVLETAQGLDLVCDLAEKRGVGIHRTDRPSLDRLADGIAHQGLVLEWTGFSYADLEDVIEAAPDAVAVLDGVEDPRNLGAAARAAFALGVGALLIPRERAAGVTASALKTSVGALAQLPVVQVDNLRRALGKLKDAGFWVVGAEADSDVRPWDVDMTGRVCLVIGGEDRGLRRLTREACDHVVAIPMADPDVSLNAADAALALFYERRRQTGVADPQTT